MTRKVGSKLLYPSGLCSNRYLCSENFSVEDPPDVLDPNLMGIASFISAHLKDNENFYKFGAQLLSSKRVEVMNIKQDENTRGLDKKCLALIKLWIESVNGPEWQNLIPAARESDFKGLATALTRELDSEPLRQRSVETDIQSLHGGKYKHNDYLRILAVSISVC